MNQVESFFWGIIAALGALFIELLIFIGISTYQSPTIEISFSQFFAVPIFIVIAACIEEIFKYIIISKRVEMFSLEKSYIVNSLFVGLGFFATEFALIYFSNSALASWQAIREIALLHIGTAGLIGYIVATKNPKKISTLLFAVILATIFHSAYNFLIIKGNFWENYLVFFILGLLVLLNIVNFFRIKKALA